ncbi:MAG: LCP family protein [Clostridia bacterium]|nr:LCP family protein [Clostridia bacterium]
MFNKNHSFKTEQQQRKDRIIRFLIAIICSAVIFLIFSLVYIIVGDLSGGSDKEITETSVEYTVEIKDQSGVKNLMLFCTSNDKSSMRFLSVVQINFDDNTYTICSFSPNEMVNAGGTFASFFEHYQSGGAKQLQTALETLNGIAIDKYIGSTDKGFKNAINSMGPLILSFDEQISYRSEDFSIVFIEGEQKVRGDDLLKYLRYCGALGDEGLLMQSQTIGIMFSQYINEKNVSRCDNLYSSLINVLSSDISVLDFKKSKNIFRYLEATEFQTDCIDYFRVISY